MLGATKEQGNTRLSPVASLTVDKTSFHGFCATKLHNVLQVYSDIIIVSFWYSY